MQACRVGVLAGDVAVLVEEVFGGDAGRGDGDRGAALPRWRGDAGYRVFGVFELGGGGSVGDACEEGGGVHRVEDGDAVGWIGAWSLGVGLSVVVFVVV